MAIPIAIGPERARARALRTDQTDTNQTAITDMAKTEIAIAMSADIEIPRKSR